MLCAVLAVLLIAPLIVVGLVVACAILAARDWMRGLF